MKMPGAPQPVRNLPACLPQRPQAAAVDQHVPRRWPQNETEWWWEYARGQAQALVNGVLPPTVPVCGPVLQPGEEALLIADVGYSRLCEGDAHYQSVPFLVMGRPVVLATSMIASGLLNHRRKKAAQREAAVQWRYNQTANVIATNDRLLASTNHGHANFWYGACSQFHPDPYRWTLTMEVDGMYPVCLTGLAVPALSVWVGFGVLREKWFNDPRLAVLLS